MLETSLIEVLRQRAQIKATTGRQYMHHNPLLAKEDLKQLNKERRKREAESERSSKKSFLAKVMNRRKEAKSGVVGADDSKLLEDQAALAYSEKNTVQFHSGNPRPSEIRILTLGPPRPSDRRLWACH